MNGLLRQLAVHGEIDWSSYQFAVFIGSQSNSDIDGLLCLSAALVCEANQQGNVCIDLASYQGKALFHSSRIDPQQLFRGPDCDFWCDLLSGSDCVGTAGEHQPLTLDGHRLYLNRYWLYETRVAANIIARLEPAPESKASARPVEFEQPSDEESIEDDQPRAVRMAARKSFSVISGGPGTGKTTTIIRILCDLIAQQGKIRIALAAPTGKAAARMMESIRNRIEHIEVDDSIKQAIPARASTIHRLLGYGRRGYRYHRQHQLPLDCVVIDEASMIDLTLMYHLLEALPDRARIILLGDRDQLASVSAGNVLGDITGHGLEPAACRSAIASSIALLRHSYRFDANSDIAELAGLVNRGEVGAATSLLRDSGKGLLWYGEEAEEINADALAWVLDAYLPVLQSDKVENALSCYEATRVLCATNRGPLGVEQLNRVISSRLLTALQRSNSELFAGLPIMIQRNHHELGLYNGDTGLLWYDDEEQMQACFRDESGGIRAIALNRLPDWVPAWATTVHKSQGSEYDSVLLLLPEDASSAVLSRELLYTAITRARRLFMLQSAAQAVEAAIAGLTKRHSGLAERLGWPAS